VNGGNQEEFERVRAQAELEFARVEARLDDQKRSQKSDLNKRLALRRARKRQTTQRQHARDLEELDRKRATALKDLTNKATTASEIGALREILNRGDGLVTRESAGAAVEAVMKKRHDTEQNELLQLQMQERSRGLKDALGDLVDSKGEARQEVAAQLEAAGATPEECHAAQGEFESSFTAQLAEVEVELLRHLEAKHATEKLTLREQQLRETAAFLEELAPDDKQRREEAGKALGEANEVLQFQESIQREREEREAKAEADRSAFQARVEEESAAEMAAQEEAMQEALEEARTAAEERMAAERAKMKAESAALRRKLLDSANAMSDGDRERLLAELDEGLAAKEEKLQVRKRAQESKLKAQLAKRHAKARRKREAENAARLTAKKAKSDEAEAAKRATENAKSKAAQAAATAKGSAGGASGKVMNAVTELSSKQASARSANTDSTAAATVKVASRQPSAHGASFVAPVAHNAPTVKASDSPQYTTIVGRLDGIDEMMRQLRARAGASQPGAAPGNGASSAALTLAAQAAWMDVTSPAPEGQLRAVPAAKLSAREALRLLVGRRLLQAAGVATPSSGGSAVQLAAADTLPSNTYTNNAYRNVYWYDASAGTLFFRRQRLWSTGDFVVCLAHAVAHVRSNADTMGNDSDAKFQAEFHRLLRLMGQQLATASVQLTAGAPRPSGDSEGDEEETDGAAKGLMQASVSELLHGLSSGSVRRDPLQRSPSMLHKLQAAVHRVTAAHAMGMSDRVLQGRDLDDAEDDDDDATAAQSTRDSQWATGSLSYRVAQVGRLAKHAELQRFLNGLEESVLAEEQSSENQDEVRGTSLSSGSHRHRRNSTAMPEADLLADLPAASAETDAATYKKVMAERVTAWEKKVDDANASYMKYQMRVQHFAAAAEHKVKQVEATRGEVSSLGKAQAAQREVAELRANGKEVSAELLESADTSLFAESEELQQRLDLLQGDLQVAQHNRSKAAGSAEMWNDRLQRWSSSLRQDQARMQRSSRQSVFEQSAELQKLRKELQQRGAATSLEGVAE
jgi:hypothetical protein